MSQTIIMRMKDMTAASEQDLCPSCTYCYERKGHSISDTLRSCGYVSDPRSRLIHGRVSDCSAYYPKSLPSVSDMERIAWEIVSKGNRGDRTIGFISPEDRLKAGGSWSYTNPGPTPGFR